MCTLLIQNRFRTALASGLTTLIGGGTGPAAGSKATTVTPGEWHIHRMLEAAEGLPINVGFTGKGQAALADPLCRTSTCRCHWFESS